MDADDVGISACTSTSGLPGTTGGGIPASAQPDQLPQVLAQLTATVNQLAQIVGALQLGAPATSAPAVGAVTGAAAFPAGAAGAPAAPAATSAPAATAAAGAAPATVTPATPARRGGAGDGPGVYRKVLSKSELERDPKLRGKLDPPSGGAPPKGVSVRRDARGARVVTINIHGSTPDGRGITPKNESIAGLRDIAAYVNSIDADVVLMQEVNDRPFNPKDPGVSAVTSVLYHLMGASDMAMTSGRGVDGPRKDNAMFTRNGFTIQQAANVDLPDQGDPARRSAGVALIQPPDGGEAFTAINTHLSHMPSQAASDRRHDQLAELDRIVASIVQGGAFTYAVPGGGRQSAQGFAPRVVLGGDLNTTRNGRHANDSADRELRGSGLRHANQAWGRNDARSGIDHIYVAGFGVTSNASMQIGARELRDGQPTDHPAVVTDLR